jgi:hypothetical protein
MEHKKLCDAHSGILEAIKAETEKADIRFQMIERSIKVAKEEMDRRLEAMNEFRAQLDRQSSTFVPRSEIEIVTTKNSDKIRDIEIEMGKTRGATKWSDHIIQVIIGAAMVIAVWLITKS